MHRNPAEGSAVIDYMNPVNRLDIPVMSLAIPYVSIHLALLNVLLLRRMDNFHPKTPYPTA
jgi:hypothetical protein